MNCPSCGFDDSKVVDSRTTDAQDAIRRRRECLKCTTRFTTYERRETRPLMVAKRGGFSEAFDFGKLKRGLIVACAKRPISSDQIDELITGIENSLQNSFKYEIDSATLGDMILVRLKELDGVAYIRFASVYKDFQDLASFTKELDELG